MARFRYVSVSDVDQFIQVPITVQVYARDSVLTVGEDVLQSYDSQAFMVTDYAIYAEIPKAALFNPSMDWKFRVSQVVDASGAYSGPHVLDAHDSVALTRAIVNAGTAKPVLGELEDRTRFVHYKHCRQFFKYSFKVGDPITLASRNGPQDAQLFAVYLDRNTGEALPYWATVDGSGTTQTPETRIFYYASAANLGGTATLATIAAGAPLTSLLASPNNATPTPVTVVAPPDPEFLEHRPDSQIYGGNLAVVTDASGNPAIRAVGDASDPSGGGLVQHALTAFTPYTTDARRALVLFWVISPPITRKYTGEEYALAWASIPIGGETGVRPLCDLPAGYAGPVLEVQRFVVSKALPAGQVQSSLAWAPRLYLPVSRYVVIDDNDKTGAPMEIPFAYQVANATDFGGDARRSIIGGRIMQLLSHYLFDAMTSKELAFFPFFLNESKTLTDKIIDQLSASLLGTGPAAAAGRNAIITQLQVKYGKKYFDEAVVLSSVSGVGNMRHVIDKLDDLFLFFTATVRITMSLRSKDDVELIRLVELPIVLRAYDDEWVSGVDGSTHVVTEAATAGALLSGHWADGGALQDWPDVTLYNASRTATATVAPFTVPEPMLVNPNGFAVKYDSNGLALWAVYLTGLGFNTQHSYVVEDPQGGVCLVSANTTEADNTTGDIELEVRHSSGSVTPALLQVPMSVTAQPSENVAFDMVVRLTASGVLRDVILVSKPVLELESAESYASVTFDANNNMFMAGRQGYAASPVKIVNANGASSTLAAPTFAAAYATYPAVYLAKFSASGVATWLTTVPVERSSFTLAVDSAGGCYVSGTYTKAMSGAPVPHADGTSSAITLPNTFTTDASGIEIANVLLRFSTGEGRALWAATVDKPDGADTNVTLLANASNQVFFVTQLWDPDTPSTRGLRVTDGNGTLSTAASVPTLPVNKDGSVYVVQFDAAGTSRWGALVDLATLSTPCAALSDAGHLLLAGSIEGGSSIRVSYTNTAGTTQPTTVVSAPPAGQRRGFYLALDQDTGACLGADTLTVRTVLPDGTTDTSSTTVQAIAAARPFGAYLVVATDATDSTQLHFTARDRIVPKPAPLSTMLVKAALPIAPGV